MLTAPLNLRETYLPLPPFSSSPFSHSLPLSPSACYPAHGIQGCFKTTSFDKHYRHFNFTINPSCSSFSSLLFSRTFFAIPLAKKMHPLFLPVKDPKSFLPLFPLLQFFTFLNELCQLFMSKVLKHPVTLFGCILGFIGGKKDTALNNTRFVTSPSEFTNFQFNLFQFSHLLEVFVIRRRKLAGTDPDNVFKLRAELGKILLLLSANHISDSCSKNDINAPARKFGQRCI
jgi:hypothetical protein